MVSEQEKALLCLELAELVLGPGATNAQVDAEARVWLDLPTKTLETMVAILLQGKGQ